MNIMIAPDSFKESLSALEAARAIQAGVADACPTARTVLVPMADGGEGTVDAVVSAASGVLRRVQVVDPLHRDITARFGLLEDGECAVVEAAAANGIDRLAPGERDPSRASTRGVGMLLQGALDAGAARVVMGIGGSATVDGGVGMAAQLGVKFFDSAGRVIEHPSGADLSRIDRVDPRACDPRLPGTDIVAACDVTNPLTGVQGAARVYAPQKGADPSMVRRLEQGLEHLADVVKRDLGLDIADRPGGGAAGGLGAGLVAFAGASLRSGVDIVMELVDLETKMSGCRLVLTGEGEVNSQSAFGKTPAGVGRLARQQGIPAVLLAGRLGEGYREIYRHGITAALAIADGPMHATQAFEQTPRLLREAAEAVVRLFVAGGAP